MFPWIVTVGEILLISQSAVLLVTPGEVVVVVVTEDVHPDADTVRDNTHDPNNNFKVVPVTQYESLVSSDLGGIESE